MKENQVNNIQLPARFANRQERRSIAEAVTSGLGMASPPYVSIKGGQFTLVDANGEQEPVETKWLDCVIFDTNLDVPIQRVFWGPERPFNPNADAYLPPTCFSDNGVGASAQAADPQSTSCQMCKWNRFDFVSKVDPTKKTKACHAIKKVAVLPVEGKVGQDGSYVAEHFYDFPFLLRVPVMSHDNLRAYGDKFKGQKFDVSDVVTRITFVHGQVGQLDFNVAGFTDEGTEALIQKFLAQHLTDGLVGRGDRPWTGALPAPQQDREPDPRPLLAPVQSAPSAPISTPAPILPSAAETPAKRNRRKAADAPAPAPIDTSLPPFLQRQQPAGQPQHGIQQNAPPPNAELESALANVFGLKT
jgi:hypothetical protein